jgi:ribosomal protein L21E
MDESDTPYTCGDYVDIIIDHESDTPYTCGDYVDIIIDHE